MTFIKLSWVVINTAKITSIRTYNNKYYINLLHTDTNGFYFGIFGSMSSVNNRIELCKEKDKDDYAIMTNWIDKNTNGLK